MHNLQYTYNGDEFCIRILHLVNINVEFSNMANDWLAAVLQVNQIPCLVTLAAGMQMP